MNGKIPLGRVAGIRVHLSWSVLLIAGFYVYILATYQFPNEVWGARSIDYWVAGVAGALLFFMSLFVHEMSHALAARRAKIGVKGITLWLLGGYAELEAEPRSPTQQFWIAAVGPLSNLGLGALFWFARQIVPGNPDPFSIGNGSGDLVGVVLGWLAFVNVLLGVFNLIPAAPLDGGQLFGAGLWAATGNRLVATKWTSYAGVALGSAGVAYGVTTMNSAGAVNGVWFMFIGWWIASVAFGELRRAQSESTLGAITIGQIMRPEPPIVPDHVTIDKLVATGKLSELPAVICGQAPNGSISGVLTAEQITSCDAGARANLSVCDLAFPIGRVTCARDNEAVLTVARKLIDDPVGHALVTQVDGRVVGTIDLAAINAAFHHMRAQGRVALPR